MTVYKIAESLPEPSRLREVCRALAMLDAVLSPDGWEERYYSYDSTWAPGEHMASMRNGSGDEYSIVFSTAGVWIRGFDHESPMTPFGRRGYGAPWPGVVDTVPEAFRSCVEEPAFCEEAGQLVATVCLWREPTDDRWRAGDIAFPEGSGLHTGDADGADRLFELLTDPSPHAYARFVEEYWEVPVDLPAIRHVYANLPLTEAVAAALNPDATLAELTADLHEIGYPYASG
ncbi:hypothetical protein [Streptomyces sp. SID3343]|uniref:hypothetical protein n=1 Tax=Streptomyces sp. SID3343 TaxID=2690260 RepID=UPI00136A7B07|nr:hypothetical protein [Streptomyces sp. SID3343]MYW05085.1 hypothetical protein [Streptomyces sp. SID3343]